MSRVEKARQRLAKLREVIRRQGDQEGVAYVDAHLEDLTLNLHELRQLELACLWHIEALKKEGKKLDRIIRKEQGRFPVGNRN